MSPQVIIGYLVVTAFVSAIASVFLRTAIAVCNKVAGGQNKVAFGKDKVPEPGFAMAATTLIIALIPFGVINWIIIKMNDSKLWDIKEPIYITVPIFFMSLVGSIAMYLPTSIRQAILVTLFFVLIAATIAGGLFGFGMGITYLLS